MAIQEHFNFVRDARFIVIKTNVSNFEHDQIPEVFLTISPETLMIQLHYPSTLWVKDPKRVIMSIFLGHLYHLTKNKEETVAISPLLFKNGITLRYSLYCWDKEYLEIF